MAGLYLEYKLRPCYVQIKSEGYIFNEDGTVTKQGEKYVKKKGLFHGWNFTSNVVEPLPMINGHPGDIISYTSGIISYTSGIVELEDGKIVCVMPNNITFADSPFKEYSWGEND